MLEKKKKEEENTRDRSVPDGSDKHSKNTQMHQHATNNNVAGIFGPLTCSFLFASALQEPGSESRLFWFQSWKIIDEPSFVLRHT